MGDHSPLSRSHYQVLGVHLLVRTRALTPRASSARCRASPSAPVQAMRATKLRGDGRDCSQATEGDVREAYKKKAKVRRSPPSIPRSLNS